ncbi:MAG: hypothetical protein AAFY60_08655, partial [Myxococcota bacterium]
MMKRISEQTVWFGCGHESIKYVSFLGGTVGNGRKSTGLPRLGNDLQGGRQRLERILDNRF